MATSIPTVDDLIARAREMMPVLRRQAAETEKRRRVSEETAKLFHEAGFFRVLQPKRHGGYEMDYGVQLRLAAELGRGCASSAWVASVIGCHAWLLGMYGAEAQDEVWGKDSTTLLSSSFAPVEMKVERAQGGINLSGRWKFSSGVDLCRWAMLFGILPPPDGKGPPDPIFAVVPLDGKKAKVEDTWHVSGLAGTGSNDIVVDNVFVPAHRVGSFTQWRGGPTAGSAVSDSHIYRMSVFAVFPVNLIGAALGAAQGALDTVVAGLAERKSLGQVKLADQQSVQLRVARAAAYANAAEALLLQTIETMNRRYRAGNEVSLVERADWRLNICYAAELCGQCVDTIFPLLGGRGLLSTDAVQRAWRDVHAVMQHVAIVWDPTAVPYGMTRLGKGWPDLLTI
jgi:alkylation response protein AidB-like acyl-CoA dehydrogenase